ncbi:MAG: hypothetical protein R3F23_02140 [Verrucomicrobiia bacterium]
MKNDTMPRPIQILLPLKVEKEIEKDGVGMGVLSDGTAYLTGSGLARMCGTTESTIREMANSWSSEKLKPRGIVISNLLSERGFTGDSLFMPVEVNGSIHHAYSEAVCTAILEYYAFESNPIKEHAAINFRKLAQSSLRAFVYVQVGYDPRHNIPSAWKQFHDRVSLTYHKIPNGFFSIFKEIADMVVAMIQAGVPVDNKTVPDISVGSHWGKYWTSYKLNEKFGERLQYEHNYPEYFPQAKSNPQYPFVYPDAALPEFRRWIREVYFTEKFPEYIENQQKARALPPSIAQLAIEAVALPSITGSKISNQSFEETIQRIAQVPKEVS